MMIPLNYHHLYYFKVIAESGGITAASRQLRLAPSTLSTQLSQLEDQLGSPLFTRVGKTLQLTSRGREALDYAREISALGEELADLSRDQPQGGALSLQLGIAHGVPRALVDKLSQLLYAQLPDLRLQAVSGTVTGLSAMLHDHRLDFALADRPAGKAEHQDLNNELFVKIPVVLGMNRKLASKIKTLPRHLHQAPMILPSPGSSIYQALMDYLRPLNIHPRVVAEVDDIELARRLALAGTGVAPLNKLSLKLAPAGNSMVQKALPRDLQLFQTVYLITRHRLRPHPALALVRSAASGLQ